MARMASRMLSSRADTDRLEADFRQPITKAARHHAVDRVWRIGQNSTRTGCIIGQSGIDSNNLYSIRYKGGSLGAQREEDHDMGIDVKDKQKTFKAASLMGPRSGLPTVVDSADGKITRIRPIYYEDYLLQGRFGARRRKLWTRLTASCTLTHQNFTENIKSCNYMQ